MMTTTELSKYRQRLRTLINSIGKLAYHSAYSDPLIQGTPGKVFRTCGQKNCKCASDRTQRHGPYLVIQVYQEKKQRQIALKQEQKDLWIKAENYQKQMQTLAKLKETCEQLTDTVRNILKRRLEKLP